MAAFSGKSGSSTIGALVVLGAGAEISETTDAIDVTSDGSSGKAAFVAGIEAWTASVSGFAQATAAMTKPTAAVSCTFVSGGTTGGTRTGDGIVTELKLGRTVRGAVTLDVTIQGTGTLS